MGPGPISLKDLAQKHNISYGTLKNKSAREGWNKELKISKREIDKKVTTELKERKIVTELEVREKNYEAADLCLDKGVEKLLKLKGEEFTAEIVIKLIQLGIKGRSDSIGISNRFEVSGKLVMDSGEDNFVKDFQDHQKNKNLLKKLNDYLAGQNEEEVIDV